MVVVFHVDDVRLGIDIEQVAEIISPASFPGKDPECASVNVMSYRGNDVKVIDFREKLGRAPSAIDRESRILVLDEQGRNIAILVDSVELVRYLDSRSMNLYSGERTNEEPLPFVFERHDLPDGLVRLIDAEKAEFAILPGPFSREKFQS
jgi:Chemotaxis signal transduction protein